MMASKGRMPPIHLKHPIPGPAFMHPEPFEHGTGLPPRAPYHSFDFPPSLEVMEQKVSAQHIEIERLVRENQRLADTHGSLRHELAAAQHELQMLQAKTADLKLEKEQEIRGLIDKISRIEKELESAESIHLQLQKARMEVQTLDASRQELISKIHQLNQELHRTRSDLKQLPVLMSELESLQQDYQHCRTQYEQERKNYNFQIESLKAMEREYITFAREAEKLRAELANSNLTKTGGGPSAASYGNNPSNAAAAATGGGLYNASSENASHHHPVMPFDHHHYNSQQQQAWQGRPTDGVAYAGMQPPTAAADAAAAAAAGGGYEQPQRVAAAAAYDSSSYRAAVPSYDAHRGTYYDPHLGGASASVAPYNSAYATMYDPIAHARPRR